MPKKEWDEVKEALKQADSPEARKRAADAFRKLEAAKKGKKSKPTLVSLGLGKEYPTSIEIKDIPDELERNPAFFEHLKEIVEEE